MKDYSKIFQGIMAVALITIVFALFGAVLFVSIEDTKRDIVMLLIGSCTTVLVQVVSYYFGSSTGSKDKSDQLNRISKT
jgi:lipopolysaccharide export LptBFGC system permease protein LptF